MYTYEIADASGRVLVPADQKYAFRTANPARQGGRVTVSFASCVDSEPNKIWNEMAALGTETVFLMGDTPYIDSSDLGVVRDRHRKFYRFRVWLLSAAIRPSWELGTIMISVGTTAMAKHDEW